VRHALGDFTFNNDFDHRMHPPGGSHFKTLRGQINQIWDNPRFGLLGLLVAIDFDDELDTTGLRCPEPLMMVRNRIRSLASGRVLKVVATDPSTTWDFPKFCTFMSHEMVHMDTETTPYQYWIRKG
jgi:tRNA 2-thiouridine synthesizing protein A